VRRVSGDVDVEGGRSTQTKARRMTPCVNVWNSWSGYCGAVAVYILQVPACCLSTFGRVEELEGDSFLSFITSVCSKREHVCL